MSSWLNGWRASPILPIREPSSPHPDTSSSSSSLMGSLQNRFSGYFGSPLLQGGDVPPAAPEWYNVFDGAFSMTRTQKMWGFLGSFCLGLLCFGISIMFLPNILFASRQFAFYYTLGNLLLVFSTMFFVGPSQQFSLMTQNNRLVPSFLYFFSLFATLLCAFKGFNIVFVFFLLGLQLFSLCWYILSYIPFGHKLLSRCFSLFRYMF